MKSLYQPSNAEEIKRRLARLEPESQRQWGKMNATQAVAHLAASMEWATGDRVPPRMGLPSIVGRIIKPRVLGDDAPIRRNTPTAKDLIFSDRRDLDADRQRLIGLIDRFAAAGPTGCTTHPHPFFGRLTPDEWAILCYKHLDHHLRQFGA